MTIQTLDAGVLRIAFEQHDPPNGSQDAPAVVLLHGFPYDVRAFDAVVPPLVAAGCRVVVPWLRGYGPTRFLSNQSLRSGQQAALAQDLLALLDALQLQRAVLAGYDWGGRAACIVAALWPQRAAGLVTGGGYNVHHVPSAMTPIAPEDEQRLWYQYYFHTERGRAGLAAHRQALCRLLWRDWSPCWAFDETTYARTAAAFDNPDFVDVVVHSYRVRYGLVAGDPACEAVERQLTQRPPITVPAIALEGGCDGVIPPAGSLRHRTLFTGPYERRVLDGVGHNLPQEAPAVFADAVLALVRGDFKGDGTAGGG